MVSIPIGRGFSEDTLVVGDHRRSSFATAPRHEAHSNIRHVPPTSVVHRLVVVCLETVDVKVPKDVWGIALGDTTEPDSVDQ